MPGFDPERAEALGIADAGELQQLRRLNGAAGQNNLAPGPERPLAPLMADGDAFGASLMQADPQRHGVGEDGEITPPPGAFQVGPRRR